jgi:hypothetical protein
MILILLSLTLGSVGISSVAMLIAILIEGNRKN